jgi:hypothetical protein
MVAEFLPKFHGRCSPYGISPPTDEQDEQPEGAKLETSSIRPAGIS